MHATLKFMSLAMVSLVMACFLAVLPAEAANRSKIETFLATTGFGVAIDSIAMAAESAPDMLGLDKSDFGAEWSRVSAEVFDPEIMRERAITILEETLDQELLDHVSDFYASDLGQKLVAAENTSHFEDDAVKRESGEALIAEMVASGSGRLELFKQMNHAIDPHEMGLRAVQEIQIRFLLTASYAGVIALRMDEAGLRAAMKESEGELRQAMVAAALVGAAHTYRDFSDDEIEAYAEALEDPRMQTVYELMNAVHYEIMMNRFEALALRLGEVGPGQQL